MNRNEDNRSSGEKNTGVGGKARRQSRRVSASSFLSGRGRKRRTLRGAALPRGVGDYPEYRVKKEEKKELREVSETEPATAPEETVGFTVEEPELTPEDIMASWKAPEEGEAPLPEEKVSEGEMPEDEPVSAGAEEPTLEELSAELFSEEPGKPDEEAGVPVLLRKEGETVLPEAAGEVREESGISGEPEEFYRLSAPQTEGKKSGKKGWKIARIAVMLVTLAAATVALLVGIRKQPGGEVTGDPAQETTGGGAVEQKIVYVREPGDNDGYLSTPELYEKCLSSTVSISATTAGGIGSIGSGFVMSEDGYIGTVCHVVAGMERIRVVLPDGDTYEAQVVGSNERCDLALLKIDAEGLEPVSFGSSEALLTGERVVAIGTPASLDYAGSICSGEVSYNRRTVKIHSQSTGVLEKKMKLIQTNAPVNPGNSGCPLFDGEGKLIGIITMRLGNSYSGMGFAIPSDGAFAILEAMRQGEEPGEELLEQVSSLPAKLGVTGKSEVSDDRHGIRITAFSDASCDAAEKLKVGDLILGVGSYATTTLAELAAAVEEYEPGQKIPITVYRSGQQLRFEVTLFGHNA